MANQKFNEFIKEVAKMAGLTDEVTITRTEMADAPSKGRRTKREAQRVTQRYEKWQCVSAHTARRSFATNMYKRDFPTLMIMKITGHQTEKAFLSYIKVTEDENAERMMKLFEEQEVARRSTNK
jgi:integrase